MLRWFGHPLVVIGVTALAFLFFYTLHVQGRKFNDSDLAVAQLEEINQKTADSIKSLQEQLEDSQSPFEQEKIIRNQLLMRKPNEYIVQLEYSKNNEITQSNTTPPLTPQQAWLDLLLD